MKTCENCGEHHEGTYGSGRFCSSKCARGFSTKAKRKEINEKVSRALKGSGHGNVKLNCKNCEVEFEVAWNRRHYEFCSNSCSSLFKGGWKTSHDKLSKEDWSRIHKKAYENGNNFVAGGTTKWIEYKNIKVLGSYELRMCEILDEQKELNTIKDWEYSTQRIKYMHDGKPRTYLIDFTVINLDGTKKYIEVKGRETKLDYIKWKSARDQGLNLEIWRYEDLFN